MGISIVATVPYRRCSILVVEDDSRVSRVIRNHLEEKFDGIRVEIAGSASKARQICEKFPPNFIVWDGTPNERGTKEEYIACIPEILWNRVIPISTDADLQAVAAGKGALPALPKIPDHINSWSERLAAFIGEKLGKRKK